VLRGRLACCGQVRPLFLGARSVGDGFRRFGLALLLCVRTGFVFLRIVCRCGDDGRVFHQALFLDFVDVGGAEFCFLRCGRSGSADVRSAMLIRCRRVSAMMADAALSKVWSFAPAMEGGSRWLMMKTELQ
jgi:hypothetical protein